MSNEFNPKITHRLAHVSVHNQFKETVDALKADGATFVMLPPDSKGQFTDFKVALKESGLKVKDLQGTDE